jgi:hypothetical protein
VSQPAGQAELRGRSRAGATASRGGRGAAGGQYRASAPAFRLRVALELGRAEGWLLLRSLVVLAGLLAGGALALHYMSEGAVSFWWAAGWQVGYGQMFVSASVLAAAQLAAGRARRAGMEDLYEGFPVSASTRAAGHLFSLVGALPASLVLIGATSALTEWRGAVGSPNLVALAAGALLVVTGGTIGVALGARFPHPLVGALGALIWIVPFSQSNRFSGPGTWLWPWVMPYQLGQFPAPVAGYPPTAAHALELAGVAGVAMVLALAWRARTALRRGLLLGVGALAIAVACIAGAAVYRPVPSADINRLVSDVASPASVQHCVTDKGVRFCVYPGLGAVLSSVEGPVAAVISHVPARPAQPLMVEQTTNISLDDASLTHGHPTAQLAAWAAELRDAPAAQASSSAVYLPVSSWPTNRQASATARFDLALATAEWALGLPTSTGSSMATQCVPVDQAREPIALWLAADVTHTQLGNDASDMFPVQAANNPVMAWPYPGEYAGYLGSPGPQTTVAGYLVAQEMTALPAQRVARALDRAWAKWANWHTTDSQLAAALGVAMPAVPSVTLRAPVGQAVVLPQSQPVCTP